MENHRHVRFTEEIAHAAADFLAREAPVRDALVTVTRAETSDDLKNVVIYVSILPADREVSVLAALKRARSDFRSYVRDNRRLHPLPTFDFAIDIGEKNRQRVDELTRY